MSKMQWFEALAQDAATRLRMRSATSIRGKQRRRNRSSPHSTETLERRVLLSIAPVFFHTQQSAASGTAPESTVVADMNGDGKPDLVVANYGSGTVSVMLGNGDGTFGSPRTFPSGPTGNQAVVADVNHDGIPDVIVANATDNTVSVLLGNGDGTLLARKIFAAGTDPRSVAVGDFNKDGKLDLAVNNTNSTVSILLGNGDGTFLTPTTTQPGADDSLTIAVGDLNGDGNPDIVTAGDNLVIDFGDGHGDISSDKIIPLAADSFSVAVADINGDGKPDVILAYPSSKSVGVLIGTGQTNLNPVQTYSTGDGSDPRAVAIADVNGDGKPDAIVINSTAQNMDVLLGKGNGSFGAPTTFGSDVYGYSFTVADVNGDGRPDLIAPDLYGSDTKVLLNDPPPVLVSINRATPAAATTQATGVSFTVKFTEPVSGLSAANFAVGLDTGMTSSSPVVTPTNGPSAEYTVTVNGITGSGNVALNMVGINSGITIVNDVGEVLQPPVGFATKIPFSPDAYDISIADVDGDGNADLVLADLQQDDVSIDLGNGDGITQPPQSFSTDISPSEGSSPSAVATADLNGDGKLDVVAAESDDNQIGVFIGNGNGALQPQVTYPLGAGDDPISIEVGDVNNDGKPDLIVANYGSATVGVLTGNGNGTFNAEQTLGVGSFPIETALVDLNRDGIPDLVIASQNAQSIGVLMGFSPPHGVIISTPPFRPEVMYSVGGALADFQVGDVNRDGNPDLIVANIGGLSDQNPDDNTVEFLEGDGQGSFAEPVKSVASLALFDAKLVDLNGDGNPDMIGIDQSRKVAMMLGNGDGTFQDEQEFNATGSGLFVADMNRDGSPDLIVGGGLSGPPGILLNSGSSEFDGQSFSILPRDVTLAVTGTKVAFDGSPHPATFTAIGANGEDLSSLVSLTYTDTSNNTSSTTPPTQLGTYEVFASFSGNESYNAISQFDTGKTVVISPQPLGNATLTITGAQIIFDGNSHPATFTAVGANGEDLSSLVSLTYENTATSTTSSVAPVQNGIHEVFASFSGNENYYPIDAFDTGKTIVISAHPLSNVTLAVTGGNAVFDGNPHSATVTATGVSDEDLSSLTSLTYTDTSNDTSSAIPPTQLGTYEVFASFAGDDSYYPISSFDTGKTIVISSQLLTNATLTVTGVDALFDGNPRPATFTAVGAQGEDLSSLVSLTYDNIANDTTSSTPPTQAGTYEIFAAFAGNSSYNAIASFDTGKSVVISPRSVFQAVPSLKLPTTALISGQKIKPIHLSVKLTNSGATTESEMVTVNIALSSSSSGTPQDPVVGTITRAVKLKANQTGFFGSITISSLPSSLSGTENVILKLTDASGAANLASAGAIRVGPSAIDLAAVSISVSPKATVGKKFAATVAVQQNGNILFAGNLPVEFFLSPTSTLGSNAIDLGSSSGHLSVQPGKKGVMHLSPIITSTVAPGSYFVIAQLDPANTLDDTDIANNISASVKMIAVS